MNSAGKASVYVDWTRDGLDERGGRDLDKGQTLATVAYQRLRDDILAGALGPNTKLLMKELSARYQLGIAPIREALARLHAEGLVRCSDHRGYWVSPLSVNDIREFTNVRMLLEREALKDSIARGDDLWEANIVASLHQLARLTERNAHRAVDTLPAWESAHEAFHHALIAASSSKLLLSLRTSLTQIVRRYRRFALTSADERDHLKEHKEIAAAVIARDADTAIELLTRHYDLTTRAIVAKFKELENDCPSD